MDENWARVMQCEGCVLVEFFYIFLDCLVWLKRGTGKKNEGNRLGNKEKMRNGIPYGSL